MSVSANRAYGVLLAAAVVSALVLFTYLPTPGDYWVRYDNESRIRESPLVPMFRAPPTQWPGLLARIFSGANEDQYQPLHTLSLAVDHALFGWNRAGFHAHALGLHLVAVLLLFFLARRLVDDPWAAAVAAALAGVHPITVEGVSWIIHRNLLVSVVFTLLGMHAYLNFIERLPHRGWLWGSTVLFTLAHLGKVNPAVALLPFALDYWVHRAPSVRSMLEKLPLVLATGGIAWINLQITGGQTEGVHVRPWLDVLLEMPAALLLNVANTFAPSNLAFFYTTGSMLDWLGWRWLIAVAIGSGLVWVAVRAHRAGERGPAVALALWLPLVAPTLLAIRYREYATADRYAHFAWMILCLGFAVVGSARARGWLGPTALRRSIAVLALVPLLLIGRGQASKWNDEAQLWTDVISTAPHPTAHGALGNVRFHRGDTLGSVRAYRSAVAIMNEFPGTKSDPAYHAGLANYALIAARGTGISSVLRADLLREAEAVAVDASERWPDHRIFAYRLGHARLALARTGKASYLDAAESFSRAAADPSLAAAAQLGQSAAYLEGGNVDEGRRLLEALFDGSPAEAQPRILLADFELSRNRVREALQHYIAAALAQPRSRAAHAGVEEATRRLGATADLSLLMEPYAATFSDRADALRKQGSSAAGRRE